MPLSLTLTSNFCLYVASMSSKHTNRHHVICKCRGGSDVPEVNVTPSNIVRHNGFHNKWGGTRLVEENSRRAILLSITEDRCPDPSVVNDFFGYTRPSQLGNIYKPEAFVQATDRNVITRVVSSTRVLIALLEEELGLTRMVIEALKGNLDFPSDSQESVFLPNMKAFFHTKNVGTAMKRLLEETHDGCHTWTQPMKNEAWEKLWEFADNCNATYSLGRQATYGKLTSALQTHVRKLEMCLNDRRADLQGNNRNSC